jgi:hypothetical protein
MNKIEIGPVWSNRLLVKATISIFCTHDQHDDKTMCITHASPSILHSMRTRPGDQQGSKPEEQYASNGLLKIMQSTEEVPVLMIQDMPMSCSMNDYVVEEAGSSSLNDEEFHANPLKPNHLLVAKEHCNFYESLGASRSDTEETSTKKARSSPLHSHPSAHPSAHTLHQQIMQTDMLDPPITACYSDDTVFDPIRILRGQRGAPPPPPRRFYAFWWRGITRAACDAVRVSRLQRTLAGKAD